MDLSPGIFFFFFFLGFLLFFQAVIKLGYFKFGENWKAPI